MSECALCLLIVMIQYISSRASQQKCNMQRMWTIILGGTVAGRVLLVKRLSTVALLLLEGLWLRASLLTGQPGYTRPR